MSELIMQNFVILNSSTLKSIFVPEQMNIWPNVLSPMINGYTGFMPTYILNQQFCT